MLILLPLTGISIPVTCLGEGTLPQSLEEKTQKWMLPFRQQLHVSPGWAARQRTTVLFSIACPCPLLICLFLLDLGCISNLLSVACSINIFCKLSIYLLDFLMAVFNMQTFKQSDLQIYPSFSFVVSALFVVLKKISSTPRWCKYSSIFQFFFVCFIFKFLKIWFISHQILTLCEWETCTDVFSETSAGSLISPNSQPSGPRTNSKGFIFVLL